MYVRHEGIRARAPIGRTGDVGCGRRNPFAELVRKVHNDPADAYNVEHYLWVLEGPLLRACATCAGFFDPWFGYNGGPAHGQARGYCSRTCRDRASWVRRCRRASHAARHGGLAA